MGIGWSGLGQPAAHDRRLAGAGSGLVRQGAGLAGKIRVLRSRRLNLSGTVATTLEDATSAYAIRPVARVAVALLGGQLGRRILAESGR